MGELSTTSGAISFSQIRSHLGDTGSISMSDLQNGGGLYVDESTYANFSLSNAYVSTSDTYWRVGTTQYYNTSGSPTNTVILNYVRYKGAQLQVTSGSTSQTFGYPTSGGAGAGWAATFLSVPELIDNSFTVSRGSLVSAGSFGASTNTTDAKGNVTGSFRSKNDYYRLNLSGGRKRLAGTAALNPNTGTAGQSISFSDLYGFDNGVVIDTTFNSSATTSSGSNNTFYRGYDKISDTGVSYGSIANDTTSSSSQYGNGFFIGSAYTAHIYPNQFYVTIMVPQNKLGTSGTNQHTRLFRTCIANGYTFDFDDATVSSSQNTYVKNSTNCIYLRYGWVHSTSFTVVGSTTSTNNTLKLIL